VYRHADLAAVDNAQQDIIKPQVINILNNDKLLDIR
jgi:hypothetical protein